jgi:hypothetical protein
VPPLRSRASCRTCRVVSAVRVCMETVVIIKTLWRKTNPRFTGAAGGVSSCRFRGAANGSAELTDGEHFVWPEGLAHYVSGHAVCLPDAVTALVAQPPAPVDDLAFVDALFRTRRIKIDSDWWGSLRDSTSSRES